MPGLLIFSSRLLLAFLVLPLRALARLLAAEEPPAPRPEPAAPAPAAPRSRPRRQTRPRPQTREPKPRAPKPRAEPTRGQVAAMREAEREAETGGPDSVGAEVHVAEPWPGYDEMDSEQVVARLRGAGEVERALVRAYEREHEAREAILRDGGEPPAAG